MMAEQPLSPGQSYDIKIAGKKTRARVDGIRYQVDINNLTQREVENLPLNGIGLVDLTFDEPLVLDRYQQNPVTGGLIFIDRLSNVTVGAVWCTNQLARQLLRHLNSVHSNWN